MIIKTKQLELQTKRVKKITYFLILPKMLRSLLKKIT